MRSNQACLLCAFILNMKIRMDSIRPYDDVIPYEIVATTPGIGPYRPACIPTQGDRCPIEMNVPACWVERQDRQVAATTWTTQVDGSVLKADPYLTSLNLVEIGQHLDEHGPERQRHQSSSTGPYAMCGFSIRNLWRNEVDFVTYCPVCRRHSITASAAANPFTSGSCTLR